ncbi:hypothetical protein U0Y97_10335 [Enterobacter chuandaensis]|uniref:hypothetical protein n=1 Tax=Enterobacter chuandaensis TaxID=2497875 RepID=UPI0039C40417
MVLPTCAAHQRDAVAVRIYALPATSPQLLYQMPHPALAALYNIRASSINPASNCWERFSPNAAYFSAGGLNTDKLTHIPFEKKIKNYCKSMNWI